MTIQAEKIRGGKKVISRTDPRISLIVKRLFRFCPKFLDLYASIYGNMCAQHPKAGRNTFYSSPRPLHIQPTLYLSVYLPAVTHALNFQNAQKVTSRWCVPGRVDSAKKQYVYYYTR